MIIVIGLSASIAAVVGALCGWWAGRAVARAAAKRLYDDWNAFLQLSAPPAAAPAPLAAFTMGLDPDTRPHTSTRWRS